LTADAIALFRPTPQVAAMRAMGAWGPWSTADMSTASKSRAWASLGRSPRNSSQIIWAKPILPISCSMG
jgi:hypothetical protein